MNRIRLTNYRIQTDTIAQDTIWSLMININRCTEPSREEKVKEKNRQIVECIFFYYYYFGDCGARVTMIKALF